jgi:2-polyprenyl-6-methoxyphenol hydroxylase-like FAD-dependent oxidoreductase
VVEPADEDAQRLRGTATDESSEASGRLTVHADIVVGADGAGSTTRRLLEELVCSRSILLC